MDIPFDKICKLFNCKDTKVDKLHLNQNCKTVLKNIGFHSDTKNFIRYIKMIPFILFFHMLMFGQLGHIIHYLANNPFSFFDVADDIATILTSETVAVVSVIFGSFAYRLDEIMKELGDFSDPVLGRARGIVAMDQLFGKYVYAVIVCFISVGILTFVFFVTDKCAPDEVSACGFIFTPYLPFVDIYNKPWRQIWLGCQCISSYCGGILALLVISQYMYVNELIILRVDKLRSIVQKIPDTKRRDRPALIKRIVKYHNILLGINNEINTALSKGYALHLCITPINMSIICYQLMGKEVSICSVMHLCSYIWIVTLTCCSGERLTVFTSDLDQTILYSIPYNDKTTALDMKFILSQAQIPLAITAGGLTNVNHLLMKDLYGSVWSTLTFINQSS